MSRHVPGLWVRETNGGEMEKNSDRNNAMSTQPIWIFMSKSYNLRWEDFINDPWKFNWNSFTPSKIAALQIFHKVTRFDIYTCSKKDSHLSNSTSFYLVTNQP